MSDTTFTPVAAPTPIPVGEILPWAIFGGLLMMIAIYFVGTEEGAMALFNGGYVHSSCMTAATSLGFPATKEMPDMVGNLLLRGMLAGVIAGVLVFAFRTPSASRWSIRRSPLKKRPPLAAGEKRPNPNSSAAPPRPASASSPASWPIAIAVGGLFALAFAFVHGRYSRLSARGTSAVIARRRLRCHHPRTQHQVSSQSAGGRQPGYDRSAAPSCSS